MHEKNYIRKYKFIKKLLQFRHFRIFLKRGTLMKKSREKFYYNFYLKNMIYSVTAYAEFESVHRKMLKNFSTKLES